MGGEPAGTAESEGAGEESGLKDIVFAGGGDTALIPRAAVQPVDMSFEEAMRFTLTAGLSVPAAKGVQE
ncbi:hypothetical protein SCL_0594 [Sulfuricaulis limicola]|uniref:Uncharacterized protein n=1 Tax=Sulfuricaulis limicola TaxID=1620215 RepID=A0A1B4XDM9_9GAMM|nr:hypothetical protein SCL_0594 [Sulfuricaulis limicola]